MVMKRVALATSEKFASLTEDDLLLMRPLERLGISAEPAVWSDPKFSWTDCDAVIIRSCWDYHLRLPEFVDWIARLERAGVRIWNPPGMLRWNANKTYLRDLEAKGIPIVPTFWPDRPMNLRDQLRQFGWDQAVVKPRVSATAHQTRLVSVDDAESAQPLIDELVHNPGAMVQQFMKAVQTRGEWSLIFFSGAFSNAVIKTPKAGDFRVQHDFGGAEHSAEPPVLMLEAATSVVRAMNEVPLYARVDGVESDGRFLLMELELIEPALFLSLNVNAPDRFAAAIAERVR
jgi:glutathione synthase/RimK-type ligase-like ATP-grasp enzyme